MISCEALEAKTKGRSQPTFATMAECDGSGPNVTLGGVNCKIIIPIRYLQVSMVKANDGFFLTQDKIFGRPGWSIKELRWIGPSHALSHPGRSRLSLIGSGMKI